MLHGEITEIIIGAFYEVHKKLSYGFLEKVYQNALAIELQKRGLDVVKQKQIKVFYDNDIVGDYYADIIVNNCVILELKAAEGLIEEHEHQLMNYLKATDIEVGLLLNFGIKPQFKRKIFTNDKKPHLFTTPLNIPENSIGIRPIPCCPFFKLCPFHPLTHSSLSPEISFRFLI